MTNKINPWIIAAIVVVVLGAASLFFFNKNLNANLSPAPIPPSECWCTLTSDSQKELLDWRNSNNCTDSIRTNKDVSNCDAQCGGMCQVQYSCQRQSEETLFKWFMGNCEKPGDKIIAEGSNRQN